MTISQLIHKISKNHMLDGGDCGMFAIALGKIFGKIKPIEIVIVSNFDGKLEYIEDFDDYDLYHVGVKIGNEYYDGSGKTNLKKLAKFAYDVYGNPNPRIHFFKLDDNIIRLIRQNTKYYLNWDDYIKIINGIVKNG